MPKGIHSSFGIIITLFHASPFTLPKAIPNVISISSNLAFFNTALLLFLISHQNLNKYPPLHIK